MPKQEAEKQLAKESRTLIWKAIRWLLFSKQSTNYFELFFFPYGLNICKHIDPISLLFDDMKRVKEYFSSNLLDILLF